MKENGHKRILIFNYLFRIAYLYQQHPILIPILQLIQFAEIQTLIILRVLTRFQKPHIIIQSKWIDFFDQRNFYISSLSLAGVGSLFLSLLLIGLHACLMPATYHSSQHKKTIIVIRIVSCILEVISQAAMTLLSVSYILAFLHLNSEQSPNTLVIMFSGISLLYYLCVNIFSSYRCLFGIWLGIFLLCFLWFGNSWAALLCGCLTLYLYSHQEHRLLKTLYGLTLVTLGWSLIQFSSNSQEDQFEIARMIYLSLSYLGYVFNIAFRQMVKHPQDAATERNTMLSIYQHNSHDDKILQLANYYLNKQVLKLRKQESQQSESFNNVSKQLPGNILEWPRQSIAQMIFRKIQDDLQNSDHLSLKIQLLLLKLGTRQNITTTLQEMSALYQHHAKESLISQYQLYIMVARVEKELFQEQSNTIERVAPIIELEEESRIFYRKVDQLIDLLTVFWERLSLDSMQKLKQESASNLLMIQSAYNQLQELLKSMTEKYQPIVEGQIVEVIGRLIDPYSAGQQEGEVSLGAVSMSFLFIITSSHRIRRVSHNFLPEMAYTEEDLLEASLAKVIPSQFAPLVLASQGPSAKLQSEMTLPIRTGQGLISFKKCILYLLPKFVGSTQFIYHLQRHPELGEKGLVLACKSTHQVIGFNRQLSESFHLNKTYLLTKFKQRMLLFTELFDCNLTNQENIISMTRYNGLKTKLSNEQFCQDSMDVEDFVVSLGLEQKFNINSEEYFLLSVQPEITKIDTHRHQKAHSIINLLKSDADYRKKYQNQTFFCPIPNPYKTKILEKNSTLKEPNRINNLTFIKVMLLLLVIMGIIEPTFFLLKSKQNSQSVDGLYSQIEALNSQYYEILNGYIHYYLSYSFELYQTNLQAYLDSRDSSLQKITYKQIRQTQQSLVLQAIIKFQKSFSSYPLPLADPIQYLISFASFDITASTSKTMLFDFISNLNIPTYNIYFLLQNYASIQAIKPAYTNVQKFNEQVAYFISTIYIPSYVQSAVSAVIFCLILWKLYEFKRAINAIESIYRFASPSEIGLTCRKIEEVKNAVRKIVKKNASAAIASEFKEQVARPYLTLTEEEYKIPLENAQVPNYPEEKSRSHCPNVSDAAVFFVFVVFFFSFLTLKHLVNGERFMSISQTFRLMQSIENSSIRINEEILFLLQKSLGRQILHNYQGPTLSNDYQHDSTYFISYIEEFQILKENGIYGNLCTDSIKRKIQKKVLDFDCQSIFNGILKGGFSVSFSEYRFQIEQLSNFTMQEIFDDPEKIDHLFALLYVRNVLIIIVDQQLNEFKVNKETFISNRFMEILYVSAGTLGVLVMLSLWGVHTLSALNKKGKLGLSLFRILPEEVMYKIHTTNYFRRAQVLSKLTAL